MLVNNSGVSVVKPVLESTEQDWAQIIDVNLKGAFLVASEVARRMRDGTRGRRDHQHRIDPELPPGPVRSPPYAASKAGLTQLTKSMALELARHSIRVNGIAPGYFSPRSTAASSDRGGLA